MIIQTTAIGKRYQKEWIFKNFSAQFAAGQRYAITGQNGSGKSTLMQVLSGYLSPSKGEISFEKAGKKIEKDEVYRSVGFCAPYIDLIDDFTLWEALAFHQRFKPFVQNYNPAQIFELLQLPARTKHQYLRFFSSGMRQRVKLALAILSQSDILLLDEPTITLDTIACNWYQALLQQHCGADRLLIIASNMSDDYQICDKVLSIMDYK